MPELDEDMTALGVHGVGHLLPTGDLFFGVDAGRVLIALALLRDLAGFGDQQTGRSALAVIIDRQRVRHKTVHRAIACQRRHRRAVRQRDIAEFVGLEEFGRAHQESSGKGLVEMELRIAIAVGKAVVSASVTKECSGRMRADWAMAMSSWRR